ncbi:MAG: hypothetical protein PHZ26_02225 [Candidatus Gracilibacteria bacterium]|nr:hypothetical protein [Candidatus Gracilibacteria bacterium]MDD2908551.1 hypothetical protein [Candidatus Gracilibacteria bacterium]
MSLQNINTAHSGSINSYNNALDLLETSKVKKLINDIVSCRPKGASDVRLIATRKGIKISDTDAIFLSNLGTHTLDI